MVSRNGQDEAVIRTIPTLETLPRRVFARAESLKKAAVTHWHDHPWVQLSYAIRGVLEVQTQHARYLAPPQRAILIPAGLQHCVTSGPETEMRSLYIKCNEVPGLNTECQVLEIQPLLRELIRSFSTFAVDYDEEGEEGRLVTVLLDQLLSAPHSNLYLPWPWDERLQPVCRALLNEPHKDATLTDIANVVSLSEKTVTRIFHKETGLTFRAWRQRLRLLSALPLLDRGDRITDVALACGYDSTSAFIHAFRNHFGDTPGQFLNQ